MKPKTAMCLPQKRSVLFLTVLPSYIWYPCLHLHRFVPELLPSSTHSEFVVTQSLLVMHVIANSDSVNHSTDRSVSINTESNKYRREHVTPLLRVKLHWLRARERITF